MLKFTQLNPGGMAMKLIGIMSLVFLFSCAHQRQPASAKQEHVAQDSIALGNVRATGIKQPQQQGVCFEVKLQLKNVPRETAEAKNWTVALIDQNDRYHLLDSALRQPASTQGGQVVMPYGHYNEWANTFEVCAPRIAPEQVKALTLTPKSLPFPEDKGLTLSWK
jgi:hypothetical protein